MSVKQTFHVMQTLKPSNSFVTFNIKELLIDELSLLSVDLYFK